MNLLVTYMELRAQPPSAAVHPAPSANLEIRAELPSVKDYLALYRAIGEPLTWDTRLRMPEEEVAQFLSATSTRTFILREEGRPVGLCEFYAVGAEDIELTHFGLVPAVYGRRLGPFLLANALHAVWREGTRRIWLHTDTNDHPKAQAVYARAGFKTYMQRMEDFPD